MAGYFTDSDDSVTTPFLSCTTPEINFAGIEEFPQTVECTQTVEVEFTDLHENKVFFKKQSRKNGKARQVVMNGLVHMKAKYNVGQLLVIRGWVRREPKAAELFEDPNGLVLICGDNNRELNLIKHNDIPSFTEDGYNVQPFSVDLGEIYMGPKQPVFFLAKSDMMLKNKFQLIIQLVFLGDRESQKFVSPSFTCSTQKRVAGDTTAAEDGATQPKIPVIEDFQANSPWSGSVDSGLSENSFRQKKILVEVLDAKTAYIENLIVSKDTHIQTTHADIAYHLRLKPDPELFKDLQEGDIVGFFVDEESGETYIQRLHSSNIHKAVHAGVVSRSHWMEGNKYHEKDIITDTVCVIGMVNVKVVGSIENGERIYASRDHPGKAIPQSHMPVGSFLRKKHVLLGMALESKKASRSLDEVNLTKCFVCIVLDVSRKELLEEIEDLYIVNEKRTGEQIKSASKKTWRRFKCCFLLTIVLVALIIFMLYQWLAPGSMFRYWLCRRGAVPKHSIQFIFQDSDGRYPRVIGIEFSHQELQEKVGVKFDEVAGPAHYYLNLDRCAYYWLDGAAGNNIGGYKYIGGGRILYVYENCSAVFEYLEQRKRWKRIEKQSNLTCEP